MEYTNILVINLMHIGDLMLATPVLRALRTAYPKARLTILADKKLRDLVEFNPHIDECMLIDKKGADNRIGAFVRYIKKVRAKHFDLVINLHRNERASALAAFSGAKRIVGYSKPGFSLFFDKVIQNPSVAHHVGRGPFHLFPPYRYVPGWKHQVTAHFDVLRETLGLMDIDDGGLEMKLPPGAEEKAASLWEENFAEGKKVVAFNIGASWETKRWPDSYFARCADDLAARGYGIAFFGGVMDTAFVDSCIAQMKEKKNPSIRVFTGSLSLGVLAGMLRRCALMITTDSGPMHIGVAMNVPVVTMFGASPVPGFYPYDEKDVLVRAPVECHPCGFHTCPRAGDENLACMKHMPPAVIMKYADELLKTYGDMIGHMPKHYGKYQCRVVELSLDEARAAMEENGNGRNELADSF